MEAMPRFLHAPNGTPVWFTDCSQVVYKWPALETYLAPGTSGAHQLEAANPADGTIMAADWPGELLMALMTNLIGGPDRGHFDLGANMEWAGDLLDEMLAGFPDTSGLTHDTAAVSDRGRRVSRPGDEARQSLQAHPIPMMCVSLSGDRLGCRNLDGHRLRGSVRRPFGARG